MIISLLLNQDMDHISRFWWRKFKKRICNYNKWSRWQAMLKKNHNRPNIRRGIIKYNFSRLIRQAAVQYVAELERLSQSISDQSFLNQCVDSFMSLVGVQISGLINGWDFSNQACIVKWIKKRRIYEILMENKCHFYKSLRKKIEFNKFNLFTWCWWRCPCNQLNWPKATLASKKECWSNYFQEINMNKIPNY